MPEYEVQLWKEADYKESIWSKVGTCSGNSTATIRLQYKPNKKDNEKNKSKKQKWVKGTIVL